MIKYKINIIHDWFVMGLHNLIKIKIGIYSWKYWNLVDFDKVDDD